MPVALQSSVDIELLIEDRRVALLQKLTFQAPLSYIDTEPSRSSQNEHSFSQNYIYILSE